MEQKRPWVVSMWIGIYGVPVTTSICISEFQAISSIF
jgi:hypothetical protein